MDEPQDGAAQSPENVGAILGVLRSVGLVGPKLALQVGEEKRLAEQLAERAKIAYGEWVHQLVLNQVKDAITSLELDERLNGGAAPPGVQSIQDSMAHLDKEKTESAGAPREVPQVVVVLPKRGAMQRGKVMKPITPEMELADECKTLQVLQEELAMVAAPILKQIDETKAPWRVRSALLGRYRVSTARRYLAYWQGFRKWCVATTGSCPCQPAQLVDYLLAREEEGMGPSVPLSVSKGVGWFEKVSGLGDTIGFTKDALVEAVVKDLLKKLEEKSPPRKRAPRMMSIFIPALERLVVKRSAEDRLRAGAWVKLVKVWASMRFDDLAHLKTDMVASYEGKLSGLLKRTKTTGAGKRVKELPFHVSTHAWVEQPEWLSKGMEALGRTLRGTYSLLVPAGASTAAPQEGTMPYQEAVAWSTEVMTALKDKDNERLIPDGWERFWTEHSERVTLSSGLAALGVAKDERDLLGRWKPEGSDQYVRSYNAAVSRMQNQFAQPIKIGDGYSAFDEGAILEELKVWLVEKWHVDKTVAEDAVEAWKAKIKPFTPFKDLVKDPEEAEVGAAVVPSSSSSSESSSSSGEDMGKVKRPRVEKLSAERGEGFIVVYNRIDRGKLHRAGKNGCWMARSRKFKRAAHYDEPPEQSLYTTRCMLCWPEAREECSSSDFEDELDAGPGSVSPKGDDALELYSEPLAGGGNLWDQ